MLHLTLLTAAALAPVQTPALSSPPVQTSPGLTRLPKIPALDRVVFDEVEGANWALGRTYKARLDGGAFAFFPLSEEGTAAPVTFELRSVSSDAGALALGRPHAGRRGDVLELRRGFVTERYKCSLESVEQTFEIDVRGARGALHLDVGVVSNYTPPESVSAPFDLGPRWRGVRIGRAFAVDGAGGRTALDATWTGEAYSIHVPAPLVARSGGTLRIDPVITSRFLVAAAGTPFVAADVACIGDDAYYLAVERGGSTNDGDVLVYRVPLDLSSGVSFLSSVDISVSNWTEPALAANNVENELGVVATRGPTGGTDVVLRIVRAQSGTAGPTRLISTSSAPAWAPDIACETGGGFLSRNYCIVHNDEVFGSLFTVARFVDADGLGLRPPVFLENFVPAAVTSTEPTVASGTGGLGALSPQRFRMAWRSELPASAGGGQVIRAAIAPRDGFGFDSGDQFTVANVQECSGVAIAGTNSTRLADGSSPYVIAWDSLGSNPGDVLVATLVDEEMRGDVQNVGRMSASRQGSAPRRPVLAATEEQWILGFEERPNPLIGRWAAVMVTGGATESGFGLSERIVDLRASSADQQRVRAATRYEGGWSGAGGREGLLAWPEPLGLTNVSGSLVETPGGNVAGVQYCSAQFNSTGARGGAWMTARGDGTVASPHSLVCTDAPPFTVCLTLTARGPGFVPNVGGSSGSLCLSTNGFGRFNAEIGVSDATGRYAIPLDPTAIPQPTAFEAAQPGETWYFQTWFRDVEGGVQTSNFSNGVAVQFGG